MDISQLPSNCQVVVNVEDLKAFANLLTGNLQPPPPLSAPETEKPLTHAEALEFLGKSRQTLTAWRKKGIVKGHMLGGRIYFLKSELMEAIKAIKSHN